MKGIEFEKGLTLDELMQVENIFQIKFPGSLREFIMTELPISKGFYNWKNMRNDNVQFIKSIINKPFSDVYCMAKEVYWCDAWGEEPEDKEDITKEVRERLKEAPKLIPIYSHRYMPAISDENPPIISIHDLDIVYYGENLEDYLYVEFGNKAQNEIGFENIIRIPFWSDIM